MLCDVGWIFREGPFLFGGVGWDVWWLGVCGGVGGVEILVPKQQENQSRY